MTRKAFLAAVCWGVAVVSFTALAEASESASGPATVWQWSTLVRGAREHTNEARAFLWIPPNCQKVRAVILAQHNMEEISILENPIFRRGMADLGFAEVWCAPPFDHLFRFDEGAGETFNGMMDDLANESGYDELRTAPVVGIGHSAAASWPYYFAAWNPERTLAALSVSGQWPYVRNPVFSPDIWGDRNIDFIPCMETMGEYESANTWSTEGLKERQQHPLMPLSMLANPAQGHFAATDKKVEYLVFYLKKAAQYRLPSDSTAKLKPIDPTKTGWLVDKWRFNQEPTAPAAPVGQYKGDPKQAFWFFDEEIAKTTEVYQAAYRGMKPQLLGYVQDGQVVPQRDTHQQVNLKFQPQEDGLTFQLTATFLDTVSGGSPRLANWTGLPVGSPIGHASGGRPISIDRICGPFVKLAPESFAVRFDKTGMSNGTRPLELWFAATHPGDSEYKPAVQQAQMLIPTRNTSGLEQHIAFPGIPDQKLGTDSVKLEATSDAKVPVYYYVLSGPATVDGNTLKLSAIPPRAKFPVKVTVVAWQWGRSVPPLLKTAEPVERTFLIVRP
ncbi:MAG TPA: hypothetical protein VMV72_10695 [Verrucomicrobiae bacterium]|nr:hypothetical protein [Verrucomicrobiae bacterium]